MSYKKDIDDTSLEEKSTIFDDKQDDTKKKKKSKRGFAPVIAIISLAVVILLVIGSVYVLQENIDPPETTQKPTLLPEIKHEVISKFTSPVVNISVTNENGGFEIILTNSIYKLPGTDKIPISNDAIMKFISLCDSFYASMIIAENADDISIYGFENPSSDIKITLEKGDKISMKFGNPDPSRSGRYCTADGKKIFLVNNEFSNTFLQKKEAFADNLVIPPVLENSKNADYFTQGELFRFDHITLGGTLRKKPISISYDINDLFRPMKITSPTYFNADEKAIKSLMSLASNGLIVYKALIFNPTEQDFKKYSLHNPPTTIAYKIGDTSQKISYAAISGTADTAIYAEGIPAIYIAVYEQAEFYNYQLNSFRSGNLFLAAINDISVFSIEIDGKKHDFDILYTPDKENAEASGTLVITSGSQKIDEDNFRTFFARTLTLMADNYIETTEPPKGNPYIKITYKYADTNKKSDVIELHKQEGIFYRYTLNGIGDQLILNKDAENIAIYLNLLLQGKTIPPIGH